MRTALEICMQALQQIVHGDAVLIRTVEGNHPVYIHTRRPYEIARQALGEVAELEEVAGKEA